MKNIVPLAFVVLVSSCSIFHKKEKEAIQLVRYEWLIGKWQIGDQTEYEEWKRVNNVSFEGEAYFIEKDNYKTQEERLKLTYQEGAIMYNAVLQDETGKWHTTPFKLVEESAGKLVFENMENDFPKRIVYTKVNDSSIDVYIEGKKAGEKRQAFKLKKVK